mmetsp:Transcript_30183/g.54876  ORF Transcript_30183/g.54876 Transcript_30183/m.54876 type:complete len:587 (-) Transcript_30183:60-1820(-)
MTILIESAVLKNAHSFAFLFIILALSGPVLVDASDDFTQEDWAPASSWEAADPALDKSLLSEIEQVLGNDYRRATDERLTKLVEGLLPVFQALPKNEYGKLGHSSVRYLLHRFFVEKHGWFVEGLFTEGAAWNASSPTHALQNHVPMLVQGFFEKRLGGRGFGLHEMAVLVSIIENSINDEAMEKLKQTYQILGLQLNKTLSTQEATHVQEVYLTSLILHLNMTDLTNKSLLKYRNNIEFYYPTWPHASKWLQRIREDLTHGDKNATFTPAEIGAMVRQIVESWGLFHGSQCAGLKEHLLSMEERASTGCVPLVDFYDSGVKGRSTWLFIETPEYLQHIGVLDQSDATNPRVLMANYINSPTNCLQPSPYYLVCCHNECDDILGQLERKIAAPTATPQEILAAIALPHVAPGKKLPNAALRKRLEEVAARHEGQVPLHGRLFAQWMHHAYPHECPYPHLSGTKNPEYTEEYEIETGRSSQLTDDEMLEIIRNASALAPKRANPTSGMEAASCAPWEQEEELFVALPPPIHRLSLAELEEDPHVWRFAAVIAVFGASITMLLQITRSCKKLVHINLAELPIKGLQVV